MPREVMAPDEVFGGGREPAERGFAQTVTTSTELANKFGTRDLLLPGAAGSHDDSGGSGGGSTIVTSYRPDGSLPHSEIVLIAGGGGGGGEGSAFYSGSLTGGGGGNGGFAYSNQVGTSATGVGGNAFDSMDHWSGLGVGGTGLYGRRGLEGGGYNTGYQGFGGASGGSGSKDQRAGSMVDPVWRLMPGKAQRAATGQLRRRRRWRWLRRRRWRHRLTVRYHFGRQIPMLRRGGGGSYAMPSTRRTATPNVPCRKYRRRRSANDFSTPIPR